jgi:hypothetical protein
VNKNVLAQARKHFSEAEDQELAISLWRDFVNSMDEESVEVNWNMLKVYFGVNSKFIHYLYKTWYIYKETFVKVCLLLT